MELKTLSQIEHATRFDRPAMPYFTLRGMMLP